MELKEVFAPVLVCGGGSEGRGGLALPMLGEDGGLRDCNLTRGLVSALGVGGAEVKDVRAEDGSLRAPAAVSISEGEGNGLEACICDTSCCDFVVSTSFFFATGVASTVPLSTLSFCLPTGVGVAESVLLSRNIWSDALTLTKQMRRDAPATVMLSWTTSSITGFGLGLAKGRKNSVMLRDFLEDGRCEGICSAPKVACPRSDRVEVSASGGYLIKVESRTKARLAKDDASQAMTSPPRFHVQSNYPFRHGLGRLLLYST